MKTGRPPKPNPLRELTGSHHRRESHDEPRPDCLLRIPRSLSPAARAHWKRLAQILRPLGLLTAADRDAFVSLTENLAVVDKARAEVAKSGLVVVIRGKPSLNPFLRVVRDAENQLVRLFAEFGLSPAARMRIFPAVTVPPPAQQVTRQLVKGKGLPQLLSRLLGGGVGGHIEVRNATPVMGQYQKHVKYLETEGGHSEEVDGDHLREVIPEESAPGLRWRLAAAHHVFAHTGLTDVDAEFQQFTVDAGCTPPGILPAHRADRVSDLARNERPSRLAAADLPGPERAKAGAMPGYNRLGLNYGQCRAAVPPNAGKKDPQQAVPSGQSRAFCRRPLKHADLMAQSRL